MPQRLTSVWTALAVAAAAAAAPAFAQEDSEGQRTGAFVTIHLPLTGDADNIAKRKIGRIVERLAGGAERPTLILELLAGGSEFGEGSDVARIESLAKYLTGTRLTGIRTVAYVPQSLKGHGVLLAAACDQIVAAPDAVIGEAGLDLDAGDDLNNEGRPIDSLRSLYHDVAIKRRTIPRSVALAMLDRTVRLYRVETESGVQFALENELAKVRKDNVVVGEPELLTESGDLASFTGARGRELGFISYLAEEKGKVAQALDLPASVLEQDPSLLGGWRPIQVRIHGVLKPDKLAQAQKLIGEQVSKRGVNFVCVWIDSPGGAPNAALQLATFLATKLDSSEVRTVAYIPNEARADAALIAMACDHAVMHPDAILGGPGALQMSEAEVGAVEGQLRAIGVAKGRTSSPYAAMLHPSIALYEYRKTGTQQRRIASEDEAASLSNDWERGKEITQPGVQFEANGDRAFQLDLARELVTDFNEFRRVYSLENDPALVEPSWATVLIEALASPGLAWILLLIGGAALWIELQTPGVGVGGFAAAVCFLLFFWSRYLQGTAMWLEAILFVAGVVCILLEMFVVPGVGVFGIGGGLLVIFSIVLASQTFIIPQNDYQLAQMRDTMATILGAMIGGGALIVVLNRFLPHTPVLNRMVLFAAGRSGAARVGDARVGRRLDSLARRARHGGDAAAAQRQGAVRRRIGRRDHPRRGDRGGRSNRSDRGDGFRGSSCGRPTGRSPSIATEQDHGRNRMGYLEPWAWAAVLLTIGLALLLAEILLPAGGAVGALAVVAVAAAVGIGFYHYGVLGGASVFLASSVAAPIAIGFGLWALPRTPIGRRLLLGDPTGPSDAEDYSPDAIRARHELIGRVGVAKSLMLPSGAVEVDGRSYDAATGRRVDRGGRTRPRGRRSDRSTHRPAHGGTRRRRHRGGFARSPVPFDRRAGHR